MNSPQLPSNASIDPTIRQAIIFRLEKIEHDENVRIIFACESGSRAWGFDSPDSDYDVRFIYVRKLPDYLTLFPKRDVLESTFAQHDLDLVGWDVRKALGLMHSSNPQLLEWMSSPIVYRQLADYERIVKFADSYFDIPAAMFHYVNMAQSNFREYLQGEKVRYKKYLYVLRPLMAAIYLKATMRRPPMEFDALLDFTISKTHPVYAEIQKLLSEKRTVQEKAYSDRWVQIDEYIRVGLAEMTVIMAGLGKSTRREREDTAELDKLLHDVVMNSPPTDWDQLTHGMGVAKP